MELSNAKRKIIDVSLDLFSLYGYEATSLSQIADAVGIKKPSLYSHFSSKQEIFDTLLEEMKEYYRQHSFMIDPDWKNPHGHLVNVFLITPEEAAEKVKAQVKFLVHDPKISQFRRLLVIEQFVNSQLKVMEEKHSYTDVMNYHIGLMKYLIEKGILIEGDPEIMALQYISPVSMQIYRIDRDPSVEEEALNLIEKHIIQFNQLYRKKA